ncbi:sulfotransferase family protein [Nocardioides pacificus]
MARERADVGSFEDIAAAAVRSTGLEDFGGTEHEEGLRILVDDLNSPVAGLTGVGNFMMRAQVKGALVARLLSQSGFTEHRSYADVAIERPIFVLGLPRTGTTAMHRLLTADPSHQGIELWLSEFPQPRPPRETWDDNPVYAAINAGYAAHNAENPELMGIHYMDASTVEECWKILRQSGKSIGYESVALVPTYAGWLAKQDWTDAYERHKANLQLIGLNDADRRWVLKNPSHLVALDALMAVYPDALIVQMHRDPVTSVASACSLSATSAGGWSTTFTGDVIGATQLDLLTREFHAFHEARPAYGPQQFVDIDYRDFVADPTATVQGIYEAFGLDWTPGVADAVRAVDAASREGDRKPTHAYTLADYGLSEEQVRAAFAG